MPSMPGHLDRRSDLNRSVRIRYRRGSNVESGIHAITLDGLEREFELDIPKGLEPGATLILVFHGYGGSSHIATTSPTRSSTRK